MKKLFKKTEKIFNTSTYELERPLLKSENKQVIRLIQV